MNPTIELMKSHRSIRQFTEQRIPRETLLELIRAGQAAATSSHVQAYSVIHVKNPSNRERIAELAGGQDYIVSCSDFLMFCADMKRPTEHPSVPVPLSREGRPSSCWWPASIRR